METLDWNLYISHFSLLPILITKETSRVVNISLDNCTWSCIKWQRRKFFFCTSYHRGCSRFHIANTCIKIYQAKLKEKPRFVFHSAALIYHCSSNWLLKLRACAQHSIAAIHHTRRTKRTLIIKKGLLFHYISSIIHTLLTGNAWIVAQTRTLSTHNRPSNEHFIDFELLIAFNLCLPFCVCFHYICVNHVYNPFYDAHDPKICIIISYYEHLLPPTW